MYSRRPSLVVGFHGCELATRDDIVMGRIDMIPSTNRYDWLGEGFYFWENSEERALEWAQQKASAGKLNTPAVLGAYIDTGQCFDLLDARYLNELRNAHASLIERYGLMGIALPENNSLDLLKRPLDCAVINFHASENCFDSVRGVFWEGNELYPTAGMREKNHIQVCVRNPNCIKAFFIPRDLR